VIRGSFLAVAERLTEPLLLLSPAAVVIACNQAAIRSIGPDLEGRDLRERVLDPEGFHRYVALASRTAAALPGATEFVGRPGRWRCDASVAVVGDEQFVVLRLRSASETLGRFSALNDQITRLEAEVRRRALLERERERLLASEQEARADAEQAARFKDELLASISHELRTPLHAISGWIALLRENLEDPELLAHGLEVIERNVDAQSRLTDDLVDSSLAITGRMRIEPRPVDLERVVLDAIESVRPAIEAKQQQLELLVEATCTVKGDRGRLVQVVWNLLSNATKYTPQGGSIRIGLRQVDAHFELTVRDTGIGISTELLPYVFDRFSRGDGATTRQFGGLGLGLAIVRHIVELHGGSVAAHSDGVGLGTTITSSLPMPALRSANPAASLAQRSNGQAALAGVRTLLVEDHDDSRELLASILRARGATVTAVDRASLAQNEFRSQVFDLVVSDIEMPEEDGFSLMRKLRDLERELERPPVFAVAVSAYSLGDARGHALRAGYQAFLAKPLRPAQLLATVSDVVARR
jgi:signal transduction histidine kinase/ActR/RegA family two-component response regulator